MKKLDTYAPLKTTLRWALPFQRFILGRARQGLVQGLQGLGVGSLLDVGCGAGEVVRLCLRAGMQATGVDSSPTMLEFARTASDQSHFLFADAASALPFEGDFDGACINLALHEMTPGARERVFEQMVRSVRPGGIVGALDYSPPVSGALPALAARIINADERGFLETDPDHYHNFRRFMADGGLAHWLPSRLASVKVDRRYLWGNLHLILGSVRG